MKTIIDEWTGCYPSKWKGVIVPEAMAHPAKYSSRLIRRIYEHLKAEGWVEPGDNVLDPFGGVGLGALDAMRLGLNWYGVELEIRFAGLGMANILTWGNRFGDMPGWGTARLFPGDSRRLLDVIGARAVASVSSPPYGVEALGHSGEPNEIDKAKKLEARIAGASYGATPGQLGEMKSNQFSTAVSSPPYEGTDLSYRKNGLKVEGKDHYERPYMEGQEDHYGSTPGQLGGMKAEGFDAAISSPPYNPPMSQDHNGTRGGTRGTTPSEPGAFVKYGNTPGQLEGMGMEGFDAAVSSPPWEKGSEGVMRADKFKDPEAFARVQMHAGHGASFEAKMRAMQKDNERADYGDSAGQLGNDSGDDFWLAARAIVEQVYQALAPGGHAVWVVKDYVKAKKIVPFCDQWRQLCEAVGFQTLHEHHASLIRNKRTQHLLEGGTVTLQSESKSFFRRLAEKNGSPRIDHETVFCMVKL